MNIRLSLGVIQHYSAAFCFYEIAKVISKKTNCYVDIVKVRGLIPLSPTTISPSFS
ncbi:hypothetical protein [Rickettsia endosymbiont of Ixodes scapularis]|uniref:hypothetical protein n=1 Tax=Rickettsia endosymbiont of Ixodes scapularis TaxID=444612 RepID=UPI0013574BD1|nr:hypothetical protein [Rickettsia endosymbiont of Ixodes scapularis]